MMSIKNKKSKRFVLIISVIVILIIVIGFWLTWKIVEDGIKSNEDEKTEIIIDDKVSYNYNYVNLRS